MSQQTSKTTVDSVLWSSFGRYKVGMNVSYNNSTWVNSTGKNSEPGVGSDWVSVGSDPLKTDRGGYTGTSQELADLIQGNTDAQNNYKSLKNLELVDLTNGGSLAVPTAGEKTTLAEVTTFLNTQTFTVNNEKLIILRVLFAEVLDSVEYLSFAHYKFDKNDVSGVWGDLDEVSPWHVLSTNLILDSRETITPYNTPSTITIDLGDILTDDIVAYLNGNAQPTSGQNWELLDGNSYFFVYTSNGSDITDFYKTDNKPVTLGTTGNYTVESTDFQRISTDGVIQNNIDADTLGGLTSTDFARLNNTTANDSYLLLNRSSSNPAMYVNQYGEGPIARFYRGSANGSVSSTSKQVTITNEGGITATSNVSATKFIGSGAGLKPLTTANTSSIVHLGCAMGSGNLCNMSTPNTNNIFDVTSIVTDGKAIILINNDTEPQVRLSTGPDVFATRIICSDFIPNENMYLKIWNNGNRTEYWFEQIAE